ncbi:MAG: hypothetical protein NPMRd3_760002 [Nitrosopumilales archaeon]|nr:MAG: hypothetical protein NPMRd3_760002 [Nitrosopumilales archaeon]
MKAEKNPKLAIFETFKTKQDKRTGEANRQRSIIAHLSTSTNSAAKTRTAISRRIADDHGVIWKNIYSGIFRDLDEVLLPLGIVKEGGRLPLKRGPKALQEQGVPFYELTVEGLLIALSLNEISEKENILHQFLSKAKIEEKELQESLQKLAKIIPKFTYYLFEKYSKAYCDGKIEKLLPFSLANLKKISDESIIIQREFLEAFGNFSNKDKEKTLNFLRKIS